LNAEQNCNTKTANRFFKDVVNFRYLGMKVTNQNYIHDESKSRLNCRNAYYNLVQNLLIPSHT